MPAKSSTGHVNSSFVKLEYSTNNGTSWTTITNSTSIGSSGNGSYSWTSVPNTPSTNCLVRVSEYNNASVKDSSNAVFSIVYPYVVLASPNGGESWNGCSAQTISWTGYGAGSGPWKVEYSLDSGLTWLTHTTSTTSTSVSWSPIPDTAVTKALVRVTKTTDALITDVSASVFSLNADNSIVVTAPNGGETWQATNCNGGGGGGGNAYYMNNTPETTSFGTFYDTGGPSGAYSNSEYYTKTFTPAGIGEKLRFTFTSFASESGYDKLYIYDGPNTSSPLIGVYQGSSSPGTVTATNSTGQLTFYWTTDGSATYSGWSANISTTGGTVQPTTITWTATGTSNYFDIDYSTNGGSSWTNIVYSYYTTGYTYNWSVPNLPSSNCKIRISDANNTCKIDKTDGLFTIIPPTPILTLTSPNGGNNYYVGSSTNITWSYQCVSSSFVTLEYSTNGGSSWSTIVNSTAISTGYYTWNPIPNTPSTNCLVRISEYGNAAVGDTSDAAFNIITPYITLNTPNGGESWNGCTSQTISWTGNGTGTGPYMVEYSTNDGTTWNTLTASTTASSYTWNPIPNIGSTQTLVRVSLANNSNVNDVSAATFNLNQQVYIIVNAPNGSESWQVANQTTQTINWAYSGTNNYFNLYYSINGGTDWNTIASSYNAGATGTGNYTWTIPNNPSNNVL